MNTENLLHVASDKYKRANVCLLRFISDNSFINQNNLSLHKIPFSVFRGMMYSFFQNQGILVSIAPYDLFSKRKWSYTIYYDGEEIVKRGFTERESAEWTAFEKCLQYMDTKMFIQDVKNRFYDYKSSSSPCNINWEHLNKVLIYRRKHLIA